MARSINPVGWFEVPVADIGRATKFYEDVFSLKLGLTEMGNQKMAFFPFDHSQPGATGALVQGESYVPSSSGSMVYFSVDSIEETLKKVEQNKGKSLTPKISIGEHGFIANFLDSEGNRVALHSTT